MFKSVKEYGVVKSVKTADISRAVRIVISTESIFSKMSFVSLSRQLQLHLYNYNYTIIQLPRSFFQGYSNDFI